MKVGFHTLGCKVNHYETEAIKEAFVSRGAEPVGEEEFADVYVINTCTVTNIADRKSRQFIRRAKRINPDALIVVTGCYVQVAADEVAAMPEVDIVVGNGRKSEICGLVMKKLAAIEPKNEAELGEPARHKATNIKADTEMYDPARRAETDDAMRTEETDDPESANKTAERAGCADIMVLPRDQLTFYEDMGRISTGSDGMTRAYIKIQDGCDRFCSYCLIPFARGPVRSRPAEDIIEEVKALVCSGYNEIVLTGINTALYGTEDGAKHSLSDLLTMLDDLTVSDRTKDASADDFRVRLSSLEPTVVDKDNVEEIIRHRRLCHHLHLSVQAGSDNVLKAMNRHYTRDEYLDIVKSLRGYDPQFGITTDIIVGFPGETEEDFRDTLDIVKEAGFGKTHVFRYSPRKGTVGAKMKDAVPENIKKERAAQLEELGIKTAEDFVEANTGSTHRVLIEEINGNYAEGYTGNYIKTYIVTEKGADEAAVNADKNKGGNDSAAPGELIDVILLKPFRDGALAKPV